MTAFRLWVFGCSHLTKDIRKGRESLADAIRHSKSAAFGGWDAAIDLGDHHGGVNNTPTNRDGHEVVRQFGALTSHPREAIYSVQGNHDRQGPGEPPGWWFRMYVDPMGENPHTSGVNANNRPYPVSGTWERYKWQAGNIVFLMISDVTRPETNLRGALGGDPCGVYTQETFDWWREQVETYRGGPEIVVTCHHYLPRNTTICTGDFEGGQLDSHGIYDGIYHGAGRDPKGSGRLHWKGEQADATDFIDHIASNPGDVALWLGAHTHARPGTVINGRTLRAHLHGCHFVNCAGLTKHHGRAAHQVPRSRLFIFEDGSDAVVVRNWYHDTSHAPTVGWHGDDEILRLARRISLCPAGKDRHAAGRVIGGLVEPGGVEPPTS